MKNWKNVDLIDLVELYATDNKMIDSEQALSDLFDSEIVEEVISRYGREDQCAIDEAFNDWADGLCKDHVIHDEQYIKYCYVGKYTSE